MNEPGDPDAVDLRGEVPPAGSGLRTTVCRMLIWGGDPFTRGRTFFRTPIFQDCLKKSAPVYRRLPNDGR